MSKKTTFLALLENAQTQTDEDRFKTFAVAVDCAEEMEESEWPNVKILIWVLRFMLKHKKFPRVIKKMSRKKVYEHPFDVEAAKARFLKSLKVIRGSVDGRLRRYINAEKVRYRRTTKFMIVKSETTRLAMFTTCVCSHPASADTIPVGGYNIARADHFFDSWEELLNWLVGAFSRTYEYFVAV